MNRMLSRAKTAVLVAVLILVSFLALKVYRYQQVRQARFTVDVLQRFIQSYRLIEGKTVGSLAEVPDFELVSPADSLRLRGKDLRKSPVRNGYIYDLQDLGEGVYVISASPIGLLTPKLEFGITEDGLLKMNQAGTDALPDKHDEVQRWQAIKSVERVRSAAVPDYLRN